MKSVFIILFILSIVVNLFMWQMMPERMAIHFGKGGQANGWADKDSYFMMMLIITTFMFAFFYFIPGLIIKIPSQYVSLPNRDIWFLPENRDIMQKKMTPLMHEMGIIILLFFGYTGMLTAKANLNTAIRTDETQFIIALYLFLGLTLYWTIKFILAFRKPKQSI